eukprot:8450068-Heterocapsa_arctica.AAC.1
MSGVITDFYDPIGFSFARLNTRARDRYIHANTVCAPLHAVYGVWPFTSLPGVRCCQQPARQLGLLRRARVAQATCTRKSAAHQPASQPGQARPGSGTPG